MQLMDKYFPNLCYKEERTLPLNASIWACIPPLKISGGDLYNGFQIDIFSSASSPG